MEKRELSTITLDEIVEIGAITDPGNKLDQDDLKRTQDVIKKLGLDAFEPDFTKMTMRKLIDLIEYLQSKNFNLK